MKRACCGLVSVMVWSIWISGVAAQDPASVPLSKSARLPLPVSLDTLPTAMKDALTKVIAAPTITAIAPAEEFASKSETYLWLLDHPDRVCLAWKRLNVEAIDIRCLEDGRFTWKDGQGSELTWRTIVKNGEGRIWYAEGKFNPGSLFPTVPVRAVAVLRHGVKKDGDGEPLIRHQVEVFLQTDSKTANLITRLIGPAAPRMAEQGAEQLLMFFSGIAKYVDRHPTKLQPLLAEKK